MKSTKLLLTAGVLLVLLAPLAYLALWWPTRKHAERGGRLKASVAYMEPLYREYRRGDYAHAKAAMLKIVLHLEEYDYDTVSAGGHDEHRHADAMLALARLARLEEKHGGAEGAAFMREAVARCERVKWREGGGGGRWASCEESYLRDIVDRMDADVK